MTIEKIWKPKEKIKREGNELILNYFREQEDQFDETEDSNEMVPEGLMTTEEFINRNGEDIVVDLYEWYRKAITRRDREPLEYERFKKHFFEGGSIDQTYIFGDFNRGYLLGVLKQGVFIPTHFAPKGIKNGYALIQELGKSKAIPTVMFITEDLVKTITKFPQWRSLDKKTVMGMMGDDFYKIPVYNSHPHAKEKILELVKNEFKNQENFKESFIEILKGLLN